MKRLVQGLKEKIIDDGYRINEEEAMQLYSSEDADELFDAATQIRLRMCSPKTSVCSIINARQGNCGEDCRYCAQSCRWKTSCKPSGLIGTDEALEKCFLALSHNVHRLSLVTAGRGVKGRDFERIAETFSVLYEKCKGLKMCASLGIISYEQMCALKKSGVVRYHHNLETSREFFSNICTTHTWQERMDTLLFARKAGLELCSGGIIGLGEGRRDRVRFALELREVHPESIPINILSPIKGTPLENALPLTKEEILRTVAVFRFIMPDATLRMAAGRKSLGENGRDAFLSGANALISGDLLTVSGSSNSDDVAMLEELGFIPE